MSVRDLPKVFGGGGLTVVRNALGNQLSWQPSTTFRHPWFTSASWSFEQKEWLAAVAPGFVNGRAPVVSVTVGTAPALTLERAKANPKNTVNLSLPSAQIDSPLTDAPTIAMSFRNIGSDDPTGAPVPEFFQKLGVTQGKPVDLSNPLLVNEGPELPPGNRLLRACDFVVQQPRAALSATTTVGDPVVDGYTLIQSLTVVTPTANQRLLLYTTPQWTAPDPQLDIEDGTYEEPTYDESLVSTLYLLSPPGTGSDSVPDASWTQYAQHYAFWNLGWGQKTGIEQPPPADLSFIIPFPSGVFFQPLVNEILANVNDAVDQLETELAAQSLAGSFWSLGGCVALPAAAAGITQNWGLNKAAANAAAAQAAKAAAAPLDPPFPYSGTTFPLTLLSTT